MSAGRSLSGWPFLWPLELGWGHCSHSPCRASGASLSEVPALCHGTFQAGVVHRAPSAVPASRAAEPHRSPLLRNWSRKPGCKSAAPAEGDSPEWGNVGSFPRDCLAAELAVRSLPMLPGLQHLVPGIVRPPPQPQDPPQSLVYMVHSRHEVNLRLLPGFLIHFPASGRIMVWGLAWPFCLHSRSQTS